MKTHTLWLNALLLVVLVWFGAGQPTRAASPASLGIEGANAGPATPGLQSDIPEAAFAPSLDGTSVLADTTPELLFSTFLGGTGQEWRFSRGVARDSEGFIYVVGATESADFPVTVGALDTSLGGTRDAFVAKLTPDGSELVYATYLGGSSWDWANAIAVDGIGNAYVTGSTDSADFPTSPGAFDSSLAGSRDVFVAKLNATGDVLLYATYLGGSDPYYFSESGYAIAVDPSGAAYVAGETWQPDFPTTPGAFDTTYNGGSGYGDAFVAKLNATGTALDYATFLGGYDGDSGRGIALREGSAFVTGFTRSPNFPTTAGAFDTSQNGTYDSFVVKLNPAGSALAYATFIGGGDHDTSYGIAVDAVGNAYAAGYSRSSNFPVTPGAYDTSYNGGDWGDATVVQLNSDGTALTYATYLGGSGNESCQAITIDGDGQAYVTGWTQSSDFPTTLDAYDASHNGGDDVFVTKLEAGGTSLAYATYLGGAANDVGSGIAVGAGGIYIAGSTDSSDFPTIPGAFDTSYGGGDDAIVAKLGVPVGCIALTGVTITGPTVGSANTPYAFTGTVAPADATLPVTSTWAPAPVSGQGTPTATYQWSTPGAYTVTLSAENCGGIVEATHEITIRNRVYLPLVLNNFVNSPPSGPNLLVNPGFEGIGVPVDNDQPNPDNWTRDTYTGAAYAEIYTPEGWVTWWSEGGDFVRPECKLIPNVYPFNEYPTRIYQGYYAGLCFGFYARIRTAWVGMKGRRDLSPAGSGVAYHLQGQSTSDQFSHREGCTYARVRDTNVDGSGSAESGAADGAAAG